MSGIRYAPSPTGRFHVGNLRTAWVSEQIARAMGLPWVVRFEDIDRPRIKYGAREQQVADLAAAGLNADRVYNQSALIERHWDLFLKAVASGDVYPCTCSRQDVAADLAGMASASHSGLAPTYSGKCRLNPAQPKDPNQQIAWRFCMPEASGLEDFIVSRATLAQVQKRDRKEYTPAYHWACAIDDMDGNYDVLVRASDLKPATRLQRAIQKTLAALEGRLNFRVAGVFHTSLITQDDGHRLEKRTVGVTLDELAVQGIQPQDLIELFKHSLPQSTLQIYASDFRTTPTGLFCESQETLTLSELLNARV